MKPGCVLRRSNFSVLEREKLVAPKEVEQCKKRMNTFGFVGDLSGDPEVRALGCCLYVCGRGGGEACAAGLPLARTRMAHRSSALSAASAHAPVPSRPPAAPQVSCVYHSEEAENQYLMGNEGGREGFFGGAKPPAAGGAKGGGGAAE